MINSFTVLVVVSGPGFSFKHKNKYPLDILHGLNISSKKLIEF